MSAIAPEALTKAPAFQMYTGDFLSSPDVALMAAHEVGAYCLLLFTAWQSDRQGYLENDEDRLRRISRLTPKQWKESRNLLLKKFVETEDKTMRYNPRLADEAGRLAQYRKKMKENGEKGGRPKKDNQRVSPENQKVISEKPESNQNESTSSSTSLKTSTVPQSGTSETPPPKNRKPAPEDENALHEVFGYYLERTGRQSTTYTLTPARKQKGMARLRECLSRSGGNYAAAVGMLRNAVDGICKSDWHMGRDPKTGGKHFFEWERHLFGSVESLETWMEQANRSGPQEQSKTRFIDPTEIYSGVEYQSRKGAAA